MLGYKWYQENSALNINLQENYLMTHKQILILQQHCNKIHSIAQ